MSRVKTVNGKRVLLAVKVSEGTAAAVDSARGELLRGAWLTKLIDAALAAEGISAGPLDSLPPQIPAVKTARPRTRGRPPKASRKRGGYEAGDTKVSDLPPPPASVTVPAAPRRPPGAAIFQDPGGEPVVADAPPAPASQRTKCRHPIFRVFGSRDPSARGVDGCCPICGHAVEPGGYWEPECDAGTCVHAK